MFWENPRGLRICDVLIASHKAGLIEPSMCTAAAFFATTIPGTSSDTCGTVQSQGIPEGQPPLVPDVLSSAIWDLPAEFSEFPECDASAAVTVDAGTDQLLPSGTYGDLTINGGTLRLEGGN